MPHCYGSLKSFYTPLKDFATYPSNIIKSNQNIIHSETGTLPII